MNQLIIVAHPKKDSFSQSICEKLEKRFVEIESSVKVRDLYKMNFNPILTEGELKYNKEGKICPDVVVEQGHINWADEITVIYPLWWNAFPAILKGYIDRVFTNGFAFKINGNGPEGLLKDKKIRLITTAGMAAESLEKSRIYEGLEITQEYGVFDFCGMKVIDHLYITSITSLSEEQKEEEMKNLISRIFETEKAKG